jgi:hypothetical protein
MATAMTGLFDQLNEGFKKKGLDTAREGNNITVQGVKKTPAAKTAKPATKPVKSSGTDEGTDQASANKNLAEDYKNVVQDEQNRKGTENYESSKKYASGGSVGSASKRADGCAQRGKTKGRML